MEMLSSTNLAEEARSYWSWLESCKTLNPILIFLESQKQVKLWLAIRLRGIKSPMETVMAASLAIEYPNLTFYPRVQVVETL